MSLEVDVSSQLQALRARVEQLEADRRATLARARALRRRAAVALAATLALAGPVALAASGSCPNGLPFCFAADAPAQAEQVNHNFAQLKEWTEQKVGAVGSAEVRIQTGPTSNVALASGKSLVVTGSWGDGLTNNGGVEFRHDNQSQGIGFGFNTVYATGTNADQDLNLKARGNGVIRANSTMHVGAVSAFGAVTVTGTNSLNVGGDLVANGNVHGACYDTGYECGWITCAPGYFMAGLDIAENENCGGGGDYDFSPFALRCCRL